jgi:hypothetical protein
MKVGRRRQAFENRAMFENRSCPIGIHFFNFNMTLNFVNVHMDIMPHDRSIIASGYLYYVCHCRDWDILVMLDD